MAYDNLVLPISVVDAAKLVSVPDGNGGMVPIYQDSKGKLPQQDLITVRPDGSEFTHLMAEITFSDLKIFFDELDIALRLQDPFIQNLYAKNAKQLAQLVRVVNYNTRSGFKGAVGSGNQLDAVLLRAEQFQDPDVNAATARTTFVRNLPSLNCVPPATGNFIEAVWTAALGHGQPLAAANNEAIALLGFDNTAAAPCNSAYQLQYLGVNFNVQNLGFELNNGVFGDNIVELKQPLFIYPGENALVTVRYYQNGSDELRPIGLWVKTATNLRSMIAS
jgi:hypothetical protein